MSIPTDLDRRFRDAAPAAACSTRGTTSSRPRWASCWSPRPTADCCESRSTRIPPRELERLERLAGRRVLRSAAAVDNAHRELDEYFAGRRHAFDLAVDLRGLTPFSERVLHELARVPFGETATYAGLAERAGKPKAARAVGTIMNRNPIPIVLPCHRIIGANGSLVGYGGGLDRKVALLTLEGVLL